MFVVDVRHDDPRVEALAGDGPAGGRDRRAAARERPSRPSGTTRPRSWSRPCATSPRSAIAGSRGSRASRSSSTPQERTRAFRDTTRELGLHAEVVATDYTPESGTRATRRLLSSPEPPTAIIFDSDLLAVTGLGVAQQMGFTVPDDLSLIGWDDSLISRVVHPPLTAITRDIGAYGATAAGHLLAVIEGDDARGRRGRPGRADPARQHRSAARRVPATRPRGARARTARRVSPFARCGNPAPPMCENRLTLNRISDQLRAVALTVGEGTTVTAGSIGVRRRATARNHASLQQPERVLQQREEWMIMVRRRKWVTGFGVIAVVVVLASLTTAGAGAQQQSAFALPRNATLYTSGTAWGPFAQFNPLRSSGNATGTTRASVRDAVPVRPAQGQVHPVARDRRQVGRPDVRRCTLRPGVKWNDGKPFTGADVKFTFETGKLAGSELSTMWKTGLSNIVVKGNTVSFVFTGKPNYLDWNTNIYSCGIVPQHLWKNYSATEITTGNTDKYMVGTGPFTYGAGKGTSGTLQWNRRSNWWATKALGMKMPMQYLVDIHNTQNTASLQNFLKNDIDLSNNFFPGVDKVIGGKVQTYYPKAPYMLSANTAWLVPNTTHAPLNDKAFRRALAMSINVDQIVTADYGNIVQKANPTGPAADLEQVDRQGPGERSSASSTTSPERRHCSPPTATRTRTVTATSRTRPGSPST